MDPTGYDVLNVVALKKMATAPAVARTLDLDIAAVEDALRPLGAGRFHESPLSPSMIFDRVMASEGRRGTIGRSEERAQAHPQARSEQSSTAASSTAS